MVITENLIFDTGISEISIFDIEYLKFRYFDRIIKFFMLLRLNHEKTQLVEFFSGPLAHEYFQLSI